MRNEVCPRCGANTRDRAQGEACAYCLYEFGDGSVYSATRGSSKFGVR